MTTDGGNEKRVHYVMEMQTTMYTALKNVKEVLEKDGACTEDAISNQRKWAKFINSYNYGVGVLTKDDQIKSMVAKDSTPELKKAVETLIWVIQRSEKAGFHRRTSNQR